ncbi:MAG: bifunctional glutamate N-acetyltransferase/amino-acid acetyltransferase ArgJ [Limnochordaceae bacterium]|nr:bifunctional glutamate N-acetyltransferase/amino-acid acetyltransferase ArgJ [Limnochordaceae bacterium]
MAERGEPDEAAPAQREGVTFPEGFEAAGVHGGIKRQRPDLAVLFAPDPCSAAAVFTTNRVKAAPLIVTREHLERSAHRVQAVVINSGNANACTGERGLADARAMAVECAGLLGLQADQVLVASTGVIGVPLPMDAVREGIRRACSQLSPFGAEAAARAILTTDRRVKQTHLEVPLTGGRVVRIGGMAKGSGMIHPNMATMLAFLTTDAPVEAGPLHEVLRRATDASFNLITVDGDTSTNDMAVLLASGKAGGAPLAPGTEDFDRFSEGVRQVATYLAKEIARDGEGATRLVEVRVRGARTEHEARLCARAVAGSTLVKAAVHGKDPNWGRIAAAAGYSGAEMDPGGFSIWIGSILVAREGREWPFSEQAVREALGRDEVHLAIDLGTGGRAEATAWSCDLSEAYVRINASYRS